MWKADYSNQLRLGTHVSLYEKDEEAKKMQDALLVIDGDIWNHIASHNIRQKTQK